MPREQINYVDLDRNDPVLPGDLLTPVEASSDDPPAQGIVGAESALFVSWFAGGTTDQYPTGHVQVALEVDISYAQFAVENPNGQREGRTLMFTPVLTRDELNKLIRTLRRARDKVYGADE
jgi:hypothetical protein